MDSNGVRNTVVKWDAPSGVYDSLELTLIGQDSVTVTSGITNYDFVNLDPGQSYNIKIVTISNSERSTDATLAITTSECFIASLTL